jgi:YidC/Oxa1 family membrane protein insertase
MDRRTIIFVLCIAATFFGMNYFFAPQKNSPPPAAQTTAASLEKKIPEEKENTLVKPMYYTLENPYQQLVFSTTGGSLAEINLPFKSEKHPQSAVLPIEFDRSMQQDYPFNDKFPQNDYFSFNSKNETQKPVIGGYYPLLRRNLILNKEDGQLKVDPKFYALNTASDFKDLAEQNFEVKEFDENHIVFEAIQPHRKITKTYSFLKDPSNDAQFIPYAFLFKIKVEGDAKGLWITSGVPDVELVSGSFTPQLKYEILRQNKSEISSVDLPKEREVIQISSIYPNWISNSNGYLGLIINPLDEIGAGFKAQFAPSSLAPTRLGVIDREFNRFKLTEYPGYNILLPLKSDNSQASFHVYAGPYSDDILNKVDDMLVDPMNGKNPDYTGSISFQGWFSFISEPFAKFLFILMNFFYKVSSSWAASIVLLTLALRVMLYPLNAWSFKSMKRMQQLAPEVSKIQEKYKKDPKKAQIEIMNLYRERKVNPFTGCLPLLIQMPFLIGMFDLLKSTFALRGAPFIPGWIDNLTAPDVLFSWKYPLPFVGNQFHLLPFILGAVMYFQQKMSSSTPKDPAQMTDQQRQQKAMGNIMVIVFTVMFYHFPSGLNIYWLSSMLLGMLQQWYTNKKLDIAKESLK